MCVGFLQFDFFKRFCNEETTRSAINGPARVWEKGSADLLSFLPVGFQSGF